MKSVQVQKVVVIDGVSHVVSSSDFSQTISEGIRDGAVKDETADIIEFVTDYGT